MSRLNGEKVISSTSIKKKKGNSMCDEVMKKKNKCRRNVDQNSQNVGCQSKHDKETK